MPDSNDLDLTPRDPDMPEDALGLGLAEPAAPPPAAAPAAASVAETVTATDPAYRVLARKYRPQSFDALIGQDAMVQTLANAIKRDRLAHAFLMTGVRGVGKTSTARLIAKALNCIGPDGQGGPTISPCGVCEPCRAIAEGRHIDVIEMDAASHTGVDAMPPCRRATRSTSSTKCTCCPKTPSTRC
jgi:DNA polymerase-3 subunit gamma/tau